MLFRVAAPINPLNPVRTLAWNATMRAGDDLKVAFTLLDEDCETPVTVQSARAVLALYRQTDRCGRWDYGMSHGSYCDGPFANPAAVVAGFVVESVAGDGRINFFMPAAASLGLWEGRYRVFITVDQPYGVSTEIEGLIQVRPSARNTLGNAPREYFGIGYDRLGMALLPPLVINGVPCDRDGFPLGHFQPPTPPIVIPPPVPGSTAILGQALLGQMILGASVPTAGSAVVAPTLTNANTSGGLGLGALGLMQIGVS